MPNAIKKEINILIVDDHHLFVEGMELILSSLSDRYEFHTRYTAYNGEEALKSLSKHIINLMILDLNMPVMDGIELLTILKKSQEYPHLKILVLTGYQDDKFTRSALKNGADGIILKSSTSKELLIAIHDILDDKLFIGKGLRTSPPRGHQERTSPKNQFHIKEELTKRELEVLVRVTKGNSNRTIANELFISPETVSAHRKNIIKKLKLKNTAELIKFAIDYNLM